ncbi:MAG: hypothetical protein KAG97_06295, partial [Victivallales bacterium]|nr:hypothetical protein [Victivallales bacterium]
AVNLDRFDIVNVIREKTGIITARKAALEEDQIRKVIKGLRGRAAPMLKNGDYDKAARLVRDYDGPMRDESVFARKRLIDEINSVVESKKSLEKRFYDSTVKLARIIAPLLLCEKMEEAKKALSVSDGERIPRRLLLLRAKWLKAVISFESWSAANKTDHSSVEPGDAELNHSFSSKSALERGLIHSFRGEFDAAENAFKELSEPAAKPFIDALIFKRSVVLKGEREKRLRKEFSDILKSYSLSFDSDRPERLLSLLGKTRISKRKAIKLASEMSVFASKAAASDFMKENANLVDAIALFCKRNSGEGIDVPLLISAKVTLSPKSDLSSAFLSAKSGAAFRLTAGVFKIPRTVISAGDITISGSDGVVLTGGPLIVKGAKCFLEKLLFKGVRIEFQNSPSSRMMKCRIDAGALRLSRSNDFVLSDSFASAVIIEDSRRVRIFHSTIVSNDESVAALRVNAKEMLVVNSIIYGRGFAVSFLRDNTNRKCKF